MANRLLIWSPGKLPIFGSQLPIVLLQEGLHGVYNHSGVDCPQDTVSLSAKYCEDVKLSHSFSERAHMSCTV